MLVATVAGCSARATGPSDVTLVFSDGFSSTHPVGRGGAQPFLQYLEDHGPGVGLDVEYFGAGQLGKQRDALHLLRSQAVDITPVFPSYHANSIPMSSVSELPGLIDDPCAGINALLPMVEEGGTLYESEFKDQGVLPLWGVLIPGYEVLTADRRVSTPDDMDGLMIRSPGGVGDRIISALGAAPVSLANTDLYEGVARKTVSGAMLSILSVPSYSLEEVLSYSTRGAKLSATTILYSISDALWHTLTRDQQDVLRAASMAAQAGACTEVLDANDAAVAKIREAGVKFTEVEGKLAQQWTDALAPVRDEWVDDLASVGLPATEVLDEFERRLAKESQ
ncbi:TRAP transporter substrate-binding protein DctP [Gordonia sp. zg691]|uniref:TRAP transporter substrate-binding protein DctP n=1 Tax=Gordonia jinghuaiqii TaxID=2758710 RepID=A0A7D7LUD9_9ACTN|nr:TRAP transporter substrate-binding protein DctP [Gordonia jinghuaiqii]MCR5980353.1 ABC transporter substrate-binding protein [Gordonia jinghuaiqii]QMT03683.1 TRAP transporter substrate-binding protein DctP [Gordonia jinghuaiqii]